MGRARAQRGPRLGRRGGRKGDSSGAALSAPAELITRVTSILSILSFMDHAFGALSKKSSPKARSSRFPPVLSSRSFTVLHSAFYIPVSDPFELLVLRVQGPS